MPTIKPSRLQSTLQKITADQRITKAEVSSIPLAVIKDLAQSDDGQATLSTMANNLKQFLAGAGESVRFTDADAYGSDNKEVLAHMAGILKEAGSSLDQIEPGLFEIALGLTLTDDRITVREVKGLKELAQGVLERADNKEEAALKMKGVLTKFDVQMAAMPIFNPNTDRESIISRTGQESMKSIGRLLGSAIAENLQVPTEVKVDPQGSFATGLNDAIDGSGGKLFGGLMLANLVDAELNRFDSDGLSGPAKLKMDQARKTTANAMLAHIQSVDVEPELGEFLSRMLTGNFVPKDKMDEFKDEIRSADRDYLVVMLNTAAETNLDALGTGVARKNYEAAMDEGISLAGGELDRRNEELRFSPMRPNFRGDIYDDRFTD